MQSTHSLTCGSVEAWLIQFGSSLLGPGLLHMGSVWGLGAFLLIIMLQAEKSKPNFISAFESSSACLTSADTPVAERQGAGEYISTIPLTKARHRAERNIN